MTELTETTETGEHRIMVRPSNGMALATRTRPRGLWGQFTTSLLRPGLFYRTLAPASETRQWLWAAILILALVGIATVRYSSLTNTAETPIDPSVSGPVFDPGMMDPGMVDPGLGGEGVFIPGDPGIPPGGIPGDTGGETPAESTLTEDLTKALLAGANIVLGWVVLTVMLIVVPMLRGRAPKIGQNLQIAVWSSLPLAVMAIVQLVYWSGGGKVGEPGVQGLLADWPGFTQLGGMEQALLISFTSRLTLYWLWSLMLVYFGARFALGGWRIVAFLIVLAWAAIQIFAPVVTESITPPSAQEEIIEGEGPFGEMPLDENGFPIDPAMNGGMSEQPVDPSMSGSQGEMEFDNSGVPPEGESSPNSEQPEEQAPPKTGMKG